MSNITPINAASVPPAKVVEELMEADPIHVVIASLHGERGIQIRWSSMSLPELCLLKTAIDSAVQSELVLDSRRGRG